MTRFIGKGVPENTDRKRAITKNKAAINNKLPISDLTLSLILHPIPIYKSVYFSKYIMFIIL